MARRLAALALILLLWPLSVYGQGPLTAAPNLRVRTDTNGYLLMSMAAYSGPDGPLTALGNIRVRTDANGYLLVTFGSAAGATTFTVSGIAATSTDGIVIANGTAATAGVPVQQSPRLRFRANVWNTTSVAATNTDDWYIETIPVSAASPTGLFKISNNLNGAGGVTQATLSSMGVLVIGGSAQGGVYGGTNLQLGVNGVSATWLLGIDGSLKSLNSTYALSSGVYQLNNVLTQSAVAPTISSGFGTSPTVASNNGTAAFTINVGTGGTATSGVIGLPTATTGWRVACDDVTTQSSTVFVTKQIATSTTTATVANFNTSGAQAAWVASNILVCNATAY